MWINGPESSSKVFPETRIGPMAGSSQRRSGVGRLWAHLIVLRSSYVHPNRKWIGLPAKLPTALPLTCDLQFQLPGLESGRHHTDAVLHMDAALHDLQLDVTCDPSKSAQEVYLDNSELLYIPYIRSCSGKPNQKRPIREPVREGGLPLFSEFGVLFLEKQA